MSYTEIPSTTFLLTTTSSASRPQYTKSGIGGRGNYHTSSTLPIPITSARSASPSPRTSGNFSIGIGGAGNVRNYEERASLSKYELMARRESIESRVPDKFHFGVGGRGNRAYTGRGAGSKSRSSSFESESVLNEKFTGGASGISMGGPSNADKLRTGIAGLFGKN